MIQNYGQPSAGMQNQSHGAGIDQPKKESRISPRVDENNQPVPGHRLDQPRPNQESMQQQNAPKKSGILKEALPYLIPTIAMGGGGGIALWLGLTS